MICDFRLAMEKRAHRRKNKSSFEWIMISMPCIMHDSPIQKRLGRRNARISSKLAPQVTILRFFKEVIVIPIGLAAF